MEGREKGPGVRKEKDRERKNAIEGRGEGDRDELSCKADCDQLPYQLQN